MYTFNDLEKPVGKDFLCVFRDSSDRSAVCAYRVSDISRVFAEGKYKSPVPVETSFVKWVMYSGDVPVPRPGAVSPPNLSVLLLRTKQNLKRRLFYELPSRKLIPFVLFDSVVPSFLFSSLLLLPVYKQ